MIDTVALTASINLHDLIAAQAEEAGSNRMWCPFCQDGTSQGHNSPAMVVTKDHYKCFGCGEGGDAIDFVIRRDGVDFLEACRRLGWDGGQLDHTEIARRMGLAAQRSQAEQARRAAELDALLAAYSAEEIWAAYNRRLSEDNRRWWENRGVPREWQDYLQLGYIQDRQYRGRDGVFISSAYTIPYFHNVGGRRHFETIQYRLDNPERPSDRYRFERGLKATWYHTTPSETMKPRVIICEGAVKAMVTRIYSEVKDTSILAIPSKETHSNIADSVRDAERVYIALDPDCWTKPTNAPNDWKPAPVKLARMIGPAARILELPEKIDDLILKCNVGKGWLQRTLQQAVKL